MIRTHLPRIFEHRMKIGNGVSSINMNKVYKNGVYACDREYVMGSIIQAARWTDYTQCAFPSFVGMLQMYSDQIPFMLTADDMVAYSVHVDLHISTNHYRRYFIDCVYRFVGLLLVSVSVYYHNGDCDTSNDAKC